jgi:hypothetical protein
MTMWKRKRRRRRKRRKNKQKKVKINFFPVETINEGMNTPARE